MGLQEVLEISGALLASLSGGFVIVFGLSSYLGKIWANRLMAKDMAQHTKDLVELQSRLSQESEIYKMKLKKSEFIFQKEFEAASEFVAMLVGFLPLHNRSEMDWNDVCDEIAQNFKKIELTLEKFLAKHGAVLPSEVKDAVCCGMGIAGEHKQNGDSPDVPLIANQAADELYKNLQRAEQCLLQRVHSQAGI